MIRIASAAHPHTGFLVADARHIPFRYNTMDIVTMMGALEYIPKSAEVVAAIASVLRPDGWLILSFPNWRSLFRRAHAFERTLTAPLRRLRGRKSLNSGAQSGEKEGYRHYQWSERTARELLEAHGFAPEYVRYCTYGLKTPWLDGNRFNAALGRWLGIRYGSTGFMAKNLAWTLVIAAKKLHSRSTKHYSP
jgi:SAM-dependent methyltransferase